MLGHTELLGEHLLRTFTNLYRSGNITDEQNRRKIAQPMIVTFSLILNCWAGMAMRMGVMMLYQQYRHTISPDQMFDRMLEGWSVSQSDLTLTRLQTLLTVLSSGTTRSSSGSVQTRRRRDLS